MQDYYIPVYTIVIYWLTSCELLVVKHVLEQVF
jgi:hypothetical protein